MKTALHLSLLFLIAFFYCQNISAQQDTITTSVGVDSSIQDKGVRQLSESVIIGKKKDIMKANTAMNVALISPSLFYKNPAPSIFESIGMINGVQPQVNCNVCNTGDIHINGMEGPYTAVLIDGMPIVSALASVYGFSGIPNSLIERVELVKGPSSAYFGSEAMGGVVNIVTKSVASAPKLSLDVMGTTWGELNVDLGSKFRIGKNIQSILGINYYDFQQKIDRNNDQFTDLALQSRISIFNKYQFKRPSEKIASLTARYVYEDRWGGALTWQKKDRGGTENYAESIYTNRLELIGMYQLLTQFPLYLQGSYNNHVQNSFYGNTPFMAHQQVGFGQLYTDKMIGSNHKLLAGMAIRYQYYDDGTPATADQVGNNQPNKYLFPGIYIEDEWQVNKEHTMMLGHRVDYHPKHGLVQSPRLAYKYAPNYAHTLRFNLGTGFRVVNLFTEEHSALSGARKVEILEDLKPEKSINALINYNFKIPNELIMWNFEIATFYNYFTNKIIGDFDTDPDKIIFRNLAGTATTRGISINVDANRNQKWNIMAGISYMEVFSQSETSKEKVYQIHSPKWSGNLVASYDIPKWFSIDLSGKFYGSMRLPIQNNDFRPAYSPGYTHLNLQLLKSFKEQRYTIYGGIKNLLNFVPKNPIMRPFDPFNKTADDVITNPNGYSFDPSYNYASLQGIRLFLGFRCVL